MGSTTHTLRQKSYPHSSSASWNSTPSLYSSCSDFNSEQTPSIVMNDSPHTFSFSLFFTLYSVLWFSLSSTSLLHFIPLEPYSFAYLHEALLVFLIFLSILRYDSYDSSSPRGYASPLFLYFLWLCFTMRLRLPFASLLYDSFSLFLDLPLTLPFTYKNPCSLASISLV